MAELTFDSIINLTTSEHNSAPRYVDKLMIGNEPSNSIFQYYMDNDNVFDKEGVVSYHNYSTLDWASPVSHMTSKKCRNFGIKTFPNVGAIGFYTGIAGESKILIPVQSPQRVRYAAPTLQMTEEDDKLTFTITPPVDTTYRCYRIVLRVGYFAFEYVTYELSLTIDKPTVTGDYTIFCYGYIDEGTAISEDSNTFTLTVSGGTPAPQPISPAYATVEYVDSLVGQIATLLDQINGVVI